MSVLVVAGLDKDEYAGQRGDLQFECKVVAHLGGQHALSLVQNRVYQHEVGEHERVGDVRKHPLLQSQQNLLFLLLNKRQLLCLNDVEPQSFEL